MSNDVITLVKTIRYPDEYGHERQKRTEREVFAEVKSVGMREKYEALALGLNPELVFILSDYYDYEGEEIVIFEGEEYRVLRTYRNGIALEITVTRNGSPE